MNFKNLASGNIYNNYQELCLALEIKPTGGKQKENVLTELNRYYIIKRTGRKFQIVDKVEKPIPKMIDARKGLWIYDCEIVLLDYLVRKIQEKGEVYSVALSRQELYILIGLCSNSFFIERNRYNQPKEFLLASKEFFYDTTFKMKDITKSLNNSLTKRMILHICDTYAYKEVSGLDIKISDTALTTKITSIYGSCLANPEINCRDMYFVWKNKKSTEFYTLLKNRLFEELGIKAVRPKILYSFNSTLLDRLEELKKNMEQITKHRVKTNTKMLDFLEQKYALLDKQVFNTNRSISEYAEINKKEYRRLIEECIAARESDINYNKELK